MVEGSVGEWGLGDGGVLLDGIVKTKGQLLIKQKAIIHKRFSSKQSSS